MATPHGAPTSSPRRNRRALIALVVLIIVIILLLLLALTRCGNDDNTTATPTSSSARSQTAAQSPTTTASTTAGSATPDESAPAGTASAGQLSAGGTTLFPLSASAGTGGDLSKFVGQPITATAVPVESVPADEGFWVGTSTTDRIWVQLTGQGESPYTVKPGQKVSFAGAMVAHTARFPTQIGVTPAEGASELTTEKAHIEVPRTTLTFSH